MKRCPKCNRIYEDVLNFCLEDGTTLVNDVDTGKTLTLTQGGAGPAPTQPYVPNSAPDYQTTPSPWKSPPPSTPAPGHDLPGRQKSSGLLILGGIGVLVVLVSGLFLYKGVMSRSSNGNSNSSTYDTKTSNSANYNNNFDANTSNTNVSNVSLNSNADSSSNPARSPQVTSTPSPQSKESSDSIFRAPVNNSASPPTLGTEIAMPAYTRDKLHLDPNKGIVIISVRPNTPASVAGLRGMVVKKDGSYSLGDIIVSIDGEKVTQPDEVIHILGKHKNGDVIQVEILSDNRHVIVPVHLWTVSDTVYPHS